MVPTITIDCVDGIELYLSAKALQAEIVSSKSSAVNISVPGPTGDYVRISRRLIVLIALDSSLIVLIWPICSFLGRASDPRAIQDYLGRKSFQNCARSQKLSSALNNLNFTNLYFGFRNKLSRLMSLNQDCKFSHLKVWSSRVYWLWSLT